MSGAEVLILTLVGLGLTGLPGVAAALAAVRLGLRSVPVILCVAMAASGAASMLTFWVYFAPPSIAPTGAYLVLFGSLGLAAWSWPVASRQRALLRQLAVPLALWALATLFVVFFGFLHGGADQALATASLRFSTDPSPFASDSSIPIYYAEWLYHGHAGSPPIFPPDWQFSDRPPVQIGYVLSNWVFGVDMPSLRYEVLGVALQQLWIVGMWALLVAARVSVRTRALAIVAALLSDVAIVSGFYVWPKLLGASFLLAALALLVSPGEPEVRRRPWTIVPFGMLCGLAFLSHGTSAFGLVPVLVVLLWRGLPDRRWVAAGAAALLVAVIPWMAYQQLVDPPANRLLKWSLAGSAAVDDRGTFETLADEYRNAGVGGTVDNKLRNYLTMAGGSPAFGEPPPGSFQFGNVIDEGRDAVDAVGAGRFHEATSKFREIRHWHLFWLFGLFLLGLPLILYGRLRGNWSEGRDWWLARVCLIVYVVGAVAWGLLMFGNVAGRAVATSSSMALPLIGIVGVVAGLRATYPRWAAGLVAANAVTTLLLFLPFLPPHPGYRFSLFSAFAATASLAALLALVFRPPGEEEPTSEPSPPAEAAIAGADG